MAVRTPDIGFGGFPKGYANGFTVKRNDFTEALITYGQFEADGVDYTLAVDATHTMTSLLTAFDHHYLYLDKSLSTPTVPVFYDELTEPVKNMIKNGWYHPTDTEDRLVGTLSSVLGDTTVTVSVIIGRANSITVEIRRGVFPAMASAMNPTDIWQDLTPQINGGDPPGINGSIVVPVNATRLRFDLVNTDVGDNISLFISASEIAPLGGGTSIVQAGFFGFNREAQIAWINLGISRNVRIAGANGNENNLSLACAGYEYER